MPDAELRYTAKALETFIGQAFEAVGVPSNDATIVAKIMADIDLGGGSGHGIFRLPQYIQRIKAGGINVTPNIQIERETDAMAMVNGDNALGHLVMRLATDTAIAKAKKQGIAWVGVHHSNHAGAASVYARMALKHDMIGIYSAVGSANHLPPWGGIEMLLSTNPIAFAIPTYKEPPIILDMATTVAAYGKVKTAAQRGEIMPEGWMMDFEGKPLTDPNKSNEGFLLPIGGYKGYGLALILGLLAGTLNGAAMGKDVVDFNADDTTETNTGQFIIAISVDAFGDAKAFKKQVDTVARQMKASPTLPGVDQVHLPGEQSDAKRKDYIESGIPVHPELLQVLHKLADDLGIKPLNWFQSGNDARNLELP
ncbi:MAG: Ldh family oxidoreductase [Rhodospirillales bacterium]|jgi:L-2-hydroxycarboxylate dehydrogenase (NAD+)